MSFSYDDNVTHILEIFQRFSRADWRKKKLWGLKASEIRLLICVKKGNEMSDCSMRVSDISKRLDVTSPTVTQMINSLIESGHVTRTTDSKDRRMTEIQLTEKGDQIAKKAMDRYYSLFAGMIDHLGKEQSQQLASLLDQVYQYLNSAKDKEEE